MKKLRQIISLLLSVLMITALFTAVPFTANAAIASYGLYLGETEVTSENAADIFGDGKASYDNSTKTLTLDNPVIPGKAKDASGYTAKIYSTLDELTIKGSYLMTASEAKYAVDAKQVIFDGNFSLYGSESGVYAYGIKFNGGRAYCWGKTGQGVQTTKVLGVYNGIQRVEFTSQFSSAVYYGKEFYKDYEVNVTTPANYSYGTHCILDGNNGNADATTVVLENPANGPKSGTTGDCTWEFDPGTGIMTISGSGEMEDYKWSNETQSTNAPWWDFRDKIKSVVIGDGVTAVGKEAFEKCANLTSLSLGKSVKEIKYDSFYGCALTSLEIPDSVETIGDSAFTHNSNLNNVSFGKNVKDIEGYAFYQDSGLTEVVLPDGVESVGYLAFGANNDLKKVTIPASVTYIREYAFGYITPDKKIEGFTIYGYPDTEAQTYAEENGFTFVPLSGTTGDCTWEFDPGTGIMTISGSGEMADYEKDSPTQSTNAPWWDFRNQIRSVVIGDGVTAVGSYAFYKCENITSITLGNSVKEIQLSAFDSCSITSVEFPESLEAIDHFAFFKCNLSEVILPDGVWLVGSLVFAGNENIKKVTVPASVTYMDEYAFGYINSFEKIEGFTIYGYPDTEAQTYAEENGFIFVPMSGTTGDCTWEFDPGTGIMTISGNGEMANYDWYSSTESTNAPWWDFRNQIKSVVIGDGVTVVGINAFRKCENITSVEFPESLETIDDAAFFKCNLSEVILPDGVRIVGNIAFAGNENIKKVTVPASVTYIGEYAFGYITSVDKIEGFTVYGYPDTKAQTYAENNGFTFVALEKKYDLWLGTTQVTEGNCDDILNDGGKAKFDPNTNTLTLNEPVITGYHTDSYDYTNVIYSDSGIENLTITGKCELESYSAQYGVCNDHGSITLNGDFVFSGTTCAVISGYDDVTISGGEISLYSKNYSCVACGDTFTVTNDVKKLTMNSNYGAVEATSINLGSELAITKPDGAYIEYDEIYAIYIIYDKNGEYAKEVVIEKGSAPARKIGDVNGDNNVDVLDAAIVQKYAAGKSTLTPEQIYAGDVNGDNNADVLDAATIQKYAAGKITEFKKKS